MPRMATKQHQSAWCPGETGSESAATTTQQQQRRALSVSSAVVFVQHAESTTLAQKAQRKQRQRLLLRRAGVPVACDARTDGGLRPRSTRTVVVVRHDRDETNAYTHTHTRTIKSSALQTPIHTHARTIKSSALRRRALPPRAVPNERSVAADDTNESVELDARGVETACGAVDAAGGAGR